MLNKQPETFKELLEMKAQQKRKRQLITFIRTLWIFIITLLTLTNTVVLGTYYYSSQKKSYAYSIDPNTTIFLEPLPEELYDY